jgi:hypothetical protein
MDVPSSFFGKLNKEPNDTVFGWDSVATISGKFFKTHLQGCYPVNDNEGSFLFVMAFVCGKMEYIPLLKPWYFFPCTTLKYGSKHYKYSFPFWPLLKRNKMWDKPSLESVWPYE